MRCNNCLWFPMKEEEIMNPELKLDEKGFANWTKNRDFYLSDRVYDTLQ